MSEVQKLGPGQKFSTPTPGNGDRVFYETLLAQRPLSHMAQEWCLAYGVMEEKDAQKAYRAMVKRKGKASVKKGAASPASEKKAKKRRTSGKGGQKRVREAVAFDAGLDAGGGDGIGMAAL